MSFGLAFLAGLMGLCLDLYLREAWRLDAWSPDFMVLVILWLGTTRTWTQGALIAASLGLLADGFAGSPAGLHMLHALLLFYLSRGLSSRVLFQGFVGRLLLGLVGGLGSLFLFAVLGKVALPDGQVAVRLTELVVPRIMVVVLFVPIGFPILDRLESLFVRRPERDVL